MGFFTTVWSVTWTTISWITQAPNTSPSSLQRIHQVPLVDSIASVTPIIVAAPTPQPPPFEFKPPGGQLRDDFTCDYSNMPEWQYCSTPENRECWLRHPDGREYNIHTDYEKYSPTGIDRYYTLNVSNSHWNADGRDFAFAKLFNNTYPGPWLQACWGDTVHVNVTNLLGYNGTSIHWHGIRQWLTMHMDGVNGVTQCPIAPNDYFVYSWKALQYGSSWYHSHYSVQYADGLQGPLTIHGPASAPFDVPASKPLLMTDWDHAPAFLTVYGGGSGVNKYSNNATIALNGRGDVRRYRGAANYTEVPPPYTLSFELRDPNIVGRAKRYLLRLINTSYDTTFVFSIDNHWLQVIGADFVPIEPYYKTSVLIGIGQRYHVIVEANPVPYSKGKPLPTDPSNLNFWIRTQIADCRSLPPDVTKDYMKTGILRYDNKSAADPTTDPWDPVPTECSDEPYESLRPKLPQTVGSPVNGIRGQTFSINIASEGQKEFPLAKFTLGDRPLRIDYGDPIFNHLDNYNASAHPSWVVIPEDYNSTDWVWLVLDGNLLGGQFVAHPIHLHGHDFAILQIARNMTPTPENIRPNRNNPPRRDVVLVPKKGFVVIAFKADNPGSWLVHCHIAFHASEGLAMQILERVGDANAIWPKGNSRALTEADRVCKNWKTWQSNPKNYYPGVDPKWFQDDSGI